LGSKVAGDAFVVKKMRAAGIVLLGHANESEDADHRAVISFSEGWSGTHDVETDNNLPF